METDPVETDQAAPIRDGERGASLVEYALLIALIAVVCIGSLQYFSAENSSGLNRSSSCIGAAVEGQVTPENCR